MRRGQKIENSKIKLRVSSGSLPNRIKGNRLKEKNDKIIRIVTAKADIVLLNIIHVEMSGVHGKLDAIWVYSSML
jgi:hypothetical protein